MYLHTHFKQKNTSLSQTSIWLIDGNLTCITTLGHSGPGSNGYKGVILHPCTLEIQNWSLPIRCNLVSYLGYVFFYWESCITSLLEMLFGIFCALLTKPKKKRLLFICMAWCFSEERHILLWINEALWNWLRRLRTWRMWWRVIVDLRVKTMKCFRTGAPSPDVV